MTRRSTRAGLAGLRSAPVVDVADLVHAADGAARAAGLLCQELALYIGGGVLRQRSRGEAALLAAVVHQTVFADVEIASTGAAAPVVGLAVRNRFLKVVEARVAPARQLTDCV